MNKGKYLTQNIDVTHMCQTGLVIYNNFKYSAGVEFICDTKHPV